MEYRFIVSGGGTSGHINPAITIADTLVAEYGKRGDTCKILFTGREEGLEAELVPKAGYEMKFIDARPFPMKPGRRMVNAVSALRKGMRECTEIISGFKPDAVIGTGGYVCAPLLMAAHHMDIPVIIHEANAFPGRANKFLARKAALVLTGFPDDNNDFAKAKKVVYTGNPIRSIMFGNDYKRSREKLGIAPGTRMVFTMGGSLGSKTLNDFILGCSRMPEFSDVRFILSSGKQQTSLLDTGDVPDNLTIMQYIDNTNDYMMAADVCITRSGAVTCAETAALPACSIMVPFPHAAHDHQTYNARAFENVGGCILVSDADVAAGKLTPVLKDLLNDEERRMKMRQAAAGLCVSDCSERIFSEISGLIG